MKNRIFRHILFWIVYTLAQALVNMNFSNYPPVESYSLFGTFITLWGGELLMLPIKLIATYGFLYYLVPRHLKPGNYLGLIFWCLAILFPLILLNRLVIYYCVYPLYDFSNYEMELLNPRKVLFSFLEIASVVGIVSTVKLLKGRVQSQRREEELMREKLQSELRFLRAQTNPHFLFNTLNNIYALARKQSENTAPVVMKLSQILRFMLYECTNPRIPIDHELKVIRDYIELEKLRYNKRLSISFNESVDQPSAMIAPLLLLPFVENAFKHGTSETRFDAFIHIDLSLHQGLLQMKIENSKDSDQEVKAPGIGLKNVQRQLELLYPNNHQLNIQNDENRFGVQLNIDLNQDL